MPRNSVSPKPRIVTSSEGGDGRNWRWLLAAGSGLLAGWLGAAYLGAGQPGSGNGEALVSAASDLDTLERTVAQLKRDAEVSNNTISELKSQLFELDAELARQRDEVSFYQRLLEAGGSVRGLAVHEFSLKPTASDRVFEFHLVLAQNLKKTRRVEGLTRIYVEGIEDDQTRRLDASLLGIDNGDLEFQFKYYQQQRGRISLPPGFTPVEVLLEVEAGSRSVSARFDWSEAIATEPGAVASVL